MLSIPDPDAEILEGALISPGGFAWWYADLLDDRGNGLVLIPSWGLPFLPGYASAARAGIAPEPRHRPSLALSIYEEGRPAYYLLQEEEPDRAWREGSTLCFGACRFEFAQGSLRAELDLPGPGGRLTGTIRVDGVPRLPLAEAPLQHPDHEWCPLVGPATGSWELSVGGHHFRGSGSAYLDRNAGRADLESLGIGRWIWCRTQLADRLRVAYAVWPTEGEVEAMLVDIHRDGRVEALPATVDPGRTRRNLWGLSWSPTARMSAGDRHLELAIEHRPDDGPFYQRHLGRARTELGEAPAIGELCEAARIDVGWQRPLIAMCVHRPHAANSPFLPLFAGPRRGRVARLLAGPERGLRTPIEAPSSK